MDLGAEEGRLAARGDGAGARVPRRGARSVGLYFSPVGLARCWRDSASCAASASRTMPPEDRLPRPREPDPDPPALG